MFQFLFGECRNLHALKKENKKKLNTQFIINFCLKLWLTFNAQFDNRKAL